jgi:histone acetyltransferase (RNA polymerase elongator complex component)
MKPLIVPFFISHQGCPHRCVFCDQVKISGGSGDFPTAAELLAKIGVYRTSGKHKSVEVAFYGGSFTSLPQTVREQLLLPLQPLIARGDICSIRVSTRPDAVDPGIADSLVRLGVRTVELGVQAMDDEVLVLADRGHTSSHVEQACRILQGAGLAVGMQLMPGLPGDTAKKALASLARVLALRPDFLRIYPALVIAGTKMAALFQAGEYAPMPLAEAVQLCKIMLHTALAAGVRVIRIGLQPTGELEFAGTIMAGPYHPAFRQLVESELCYDLLCKLTGEIPAEAPVTVFCTPAGVSDITGQGRSNLQRLARERGVRVAAVRSDPTLARREIRVTSLQRVKKGNIVRDLDYTAEGASFVR